MQYTEIFNVVKKKKKKKNNNNNHHNNNIFAQNKDCGYTTLEPPRRGGSSEYPQFIFGAKIRKIGIPL